MFNFRKFTPGFNKVSLEEKMMFAKHLSLMLKAGLPLREGVATVEDQIEAGYFKETLKDILKHLEAGESLGDSLEKHSDVFDDLAINVVKVGEGSGTLQENLFYLAEQLEKSYKLKRKVRAAMIYPVLVLAATIGLAAGLAIFVLPKLSSLFKSLDFVLPWPTKVLLWLTEMFQTNGLLILGGFLAVVVLLIALSRWRPVRKFNHWLLTHLPIVGPISRNKNLAEFNRNMGLLLKSGIPVLKAIQITTDSMGNLVYQEKLRKVKDNIEAGEKISSNLEEFPHYFPKTATRMVAVGEKSGSLVESFSYLGDFYEEEVDSTMQNLSSVLEPVLLVIIALLVGFVAVSIILPIYRLTGNLAV